jgi:ubiquitin carboxyl-terminal hydrolase 14
VRFYWKHESVSAGTQAGKAKILRKVQYPRVLDVYEFCSDSLKKQLDEGREIERKEREAEDAKRLQGIAEQEAVKPGQDVEMKDANEEEKQAKKAVGKAARAEEKLKMLKKEDERLYRQHGRGLDTGNY